MDHVVRAHVLSSSIVRVKIWDPTGRILYSDAPALIAERFPLGAGEHDVLTNPRLARTCRT
jgi:two-component system, NarL family, sensor kinase